MVSAYVGPPPSGAFLIKSWKKGNSRHSQSGTEGVNLFPTLGRGSQEGS